ncbi:hypothetical protein [Vreelandella aquamarina]|uniref:hypothetical protein n=1 Tax=Vreelandella aquamarina TaxID=77097 RepID=UPI00384F2549
MKTSMKRYSRATRSMSPADKLARGLGWLSLGVGLYQLVAPRRLGRALGMPHRDNKKIRACGAREIVSGIGALSDNPTNAIWSRVVGDVLDFSVLTFALKRHTAHKENLYLALTAVGVLTVVDYSCAKALSQRHAYQGGITPDYSQRSGFPGGVESAWGAARAEGSKAQVPPRLPAPNAM